jgi:hypothetical protein
MNKLWWFLLVLFVIFVAGGLFIAPVKKIRMSDFTWSVRDKTVIYEFTITNGTNWRMKAMVMLVAENKTENPEGTKIETIGSVTLNFALGPHEKRVMRGEIPLMKAGSSLTGVSSFTDFENQNF